MAEERNYKDRLFCFIFGSEAHKDWTLSLYNAVNGTSYSDPDLITIATLEIVLYMGMHNDVAFLMRKKCLSGWLLTTRSMRCPKIFPSDPCWKPTEWR